MSFVLTCFLSMLLNTIFPNHVLGQQRKATEESIEINRYATEIKLIDEQITEVAVNLNIQVYQATQQPNLIVELPSSEQVKVLSNRIRITDSRGNVLRKQNLSKILIEHSVSLNFSDSTIAKSASYPLTVEWVFRVVLIKPSGSYFWPAITGNYSIINYSGIRLFADNGLLNATQSNIEPSARLIDQSSDTNGMLWDITGFDGKKAWQKAKPIDNPSVKIAF